MFRYRAIRKRPKYKSTWHLFRLSDCPALLWDDTFFLAGKPQTPVMCLDSIVRGHPSRDMFEGDYVKDSKTDEVLGVVVYNNGFYMQKESDGIRKTIPYEHIYIDKGDKESIDILHKFARTPINFRYLNTIFDFGNLVSVEGDTLNIIVRKKHHKVLLNGVSELVYYNETTNEKLFDGDIYNGTFVTIENVNRIFLD